MSIEICTVCYNFQRRWTMQLASLVQQIEPPDLLINIAYVKGNGNPDVETVVKFYEQKGLRFKLTPYDESLRKRGFIRNLQVENSTEDWIYFNDCDLVYGPYYFNYVEKYLDPEFDGVRGFRPVAHTSVESANSFLENFEMYVKSVYKVVSSFEIERISKRNVVHGGSQLVRRQQIFDCCNGYYVDPKSFKRDFSMGFNLTRSDKYFRKRFSKKKIINGAPLTFHVGHYRIQENGIPNPKFDINTQR